jgi:hypothetical protein
MPEFTGVDIIDHLYNSGKISKHKIILFTASSITDEEIGKLIKKRGTFLPQKTCKIRSPIKNDRSLSKN